MTKISARIWTAPGSNKIAVQKGDITESIEIRKTDGRKVSVGGRELLFLALATCYRNALFTEAEKRGIALEEVAVVVDGHLGDAGETRPAENIVYRASVKSDATESQLRDLLVHADRTAVVGNAIRSATSVELELIFDRM